MERKIGEIFTYKGKTYKVVAYGWSCNDCAFFKNNHCRGDKLIIGECIFFIFILFISLNITLVLSFL